MELYFIITRSRLILFFPESYGYSHIKYQWNITEITYWQNNACGGGCNSFEENEFLISIEVNFHSSSISDVWFALIKHYKKVICFMHYFSLCLLKYWLFTVGKFTVFCNVFSPPIPNFHLRKWHYSPFPMAAQARRWKSSLFPLPTFTSLKSIHQYGVQISYCKSLFVYICPFSILLLFPELHPPLAGLHHGSVSSSSLIGFPY